MISSASWAAVISRYRVAAAQQLGVDGVLDPQLNDVDAAAQRGVQELVGLRVADQVQRGASQPFTAIGHGTSLPRS